MDQYVTWFGGRYHDEFYTDARIRQALPGLGRASRRAREHRDRGGLPRRPHDLLLAARERAALHQREPAGVRHVHRRDAHRLGRRDVPARQVARPEPPRLGRRRGLPGPRQRGGLALQRGGRRRPRGAAAAAGRRLRHLPPLPRPLGQGRPRGARSGSPTTSPPPPRSASRPCWRSSACATRARGTPSTRSGRAPSAPAAARAGTSGSSPASLDDGSLYPDYDGFTVYHPSSTATLLAAEAARIRAAAPEPQPAPTTLRGAAAGKSIVIGTAVAAGPLASEPVYAATARPRVLRRDTRERDEVGRHRAHPRPVRVRRRGPDRGRGPGARPAGARARARLAQPAPRLGAGPRRHAAARRDAEPHRRPWPGTSPAT